VLEQSVVGAGGAGGANRPSGAAELVARLDRLPGSRSLWIMILTLALGGFFEYYDIYLTAYLSPGLVQSGIFQSGAKGLFGLPDQATFASVTFAGFFVGSALFGSLADRIGRRAIFTYSILWYSAATVFLALSSSALAVDWWRFVAGIGIGVELVTVDAYVAEIVPKAIRGRAFAFTQFICALAVPVVAFIGWMLVPLSPMGVPGWRLVALIGALGAILVWWLRRNLPESPRWLSLHGKHDEAERVTAMIEARVAADTGQPLPAPGRALEEAPGTSSFRDIWKPPYRKRTIILAVFNFFQTIGIFGFGNWIPALLISQGASVMHSLQYSFIIAVAYPVGPILWTSIADRFERKWLIVLGALGIAVFGLLFSLQASALYIIVIGVLIQLSNTLLTSTYHAYQAELFPTRIRARAVGFVYSMSRLSTVFTSLMIGFFLQNFGSVGVFSFIAVSMLVVMISIGVFGPRTNGLSLEEVAH
jgi:putative MFS transporter